MALSGGSYASLTDVFNSFLKQGYSPQQAANLTGVMGSEGSAAGGVYTGSFGYQPTENGGVLNPSGAYGIMQANGQQQSLLQNYANQNGLNVNDLDTQTGYLSTQIPPSMANSTYGIVTGYERPAASNIPGEVNNANVIAADRLQDYQQDAADDGIAPQNIGGNSPGSPYGMLSPGGGGYGLGVQQSPDTSGGSLTYAGPGDTSQYNANSGQVSITSVPVTQCASASQVTQCASAAGIGNIPAGAVTNPGAMASLPGPLQSILGQSSATATGQGSIVSGPWSMLGTVATTTGDTAIAQATASAGNAQASATNSLSKQQAQSTQATNQTNTANTASLVNAANTDTNTILGTGKDLFVRGFFGIFGAILLAGAVVYFMRNSEELHAT